MNFAEYNAAYVAFELRLENLKLKKAANQYTKIQYDAELDALIAESDFLQEQGLKLLAKELVTTGIAIEEDHWIVECPDCNLEYEFQGYFDSGEPVKCDCGISFKVTKIIFSNGAYIE